MISPLPISEHLSQQGTDPALNRLIEHVAAACLHIADEVSKGGLGDVMGSAETENVQGETQKKLDIVSNDIMLKAGIDSGVLKAMASEEEETIFHVPNADQQAPYMLVFDPLDGSSNIEVNVSIGTIFSVLNAPEGEVSEDSMLQPGNQQVAAGYIVYGPSTQFLLTVGNGSHLYTLDPTRREFLLTAENMVIPAETREFAINASNSRHWFLPVKRYVDECLAGKTGPREEDFNMRWIASMVADVHRIVNRGGIFLYPGDQKLAANGKEGKLRLLYEANPMTFLVEQAGGRGSIGTQSILSVQPKALHQRVPVMLGSRHEVERLEQYHLAN